MQNIRTRSHIGRDGMLKLEIPTELAEIDIDVVVIFQPVEAPEKKPSPEELGWPPGFFEKTAGQWQGDSLTREPQGEYETRKNCNDLPSRYQYMHRVSESTFDIGKGTVICTPS